MLDVLIKSLTQDAPTAILLLALCVAALALWIVSLTRKQKKYELRWRALLSDSRGESLENLLYDHLTQREKVGRRLDAIESRLDNIDELMLSSKRFVGLVRYDAFPDVAGSQSFALAVYDDKGDGAVLSSIVGRNTCRVYCKPLVGGRSERDLSQEEQRAIRAGRDGGMRAIVSP
jgi:hypothetical protein